MQFVPLMTLQHFAELSGASYRTVDEWSKRGKIPTVKIGKRRMVNVAAITEEVLQNEHDILMAAQNAVDAIGRG